MMAPTGQGWWQGLNVGACVSRLTASFLWGWRLDRSRLGEGGLFLPESPLGSSFPGRPSCRSRASWRWKERRDTQSWPSPWLNVQVQRPNSRPPGVSAVFRQDRRGGEAAPAVPCPHAAQPALRVTLLSARLSAGPAPGNAETPILRFSFENAPKTFFMQYLRFILKCFFPNTFKNIFCYYGNFQGEGKGEIC